MEKAITRLTIDLEIAETNARINEARGNAELARHERECAASYRAAIEELKRKAE